MGPDRLNGQNGGNTARGDLLQDIRTLATFSSGSQGVSRLPWTPEHRAATDWLARKFESEGLRSHLDTAGNLFGYWEVGEGPVVLVGSHIDTVPDGGRFDGALGVLAGLDAIRLLKSRRVVPLRPVWIASFMDEEGVRFGTALFGSRAFVGEDIRELAQAIDTEGVTLREAMGREGRSFDDLPFACRIGDVGTYLELHIEQGPVLEREGMDIGVVLGIVGVLRLDVRFRGEANHAGTTPLEERHDALVGAARAIADIRDGVRGMDGVVATVGRISVAPGASNIVPGEASLTIDVRAAVDGDFGQAEAFVKEILERVAADEGLTLDVRETHRAGPTPLDSDLADLIEEAAKLEGARSMRLYSGAGHDAMALAPHVRTGMLFVPSSRGVSHSPHESTPAHQCEIGAQVLARALELIVTA